MEARVEISDEAIKSGAVLLSNYLYLTLSEREQAALRCQSDAALRGGARLVVAAELERIAATLHTSCRVDDLIATAEAGARNGVRNELLARASELRGEA